MKTRTTGKRPRTLVTAPAPPANVIMQHGLPLEAVVHEPPEPAQDSDAESEMQDDTHAPAKGGKEAAWPYTEFTRNEYTPVNKLHCRHCGKRISSQNTTRLKYHLLNRQQCPTYLDYAKRHGEGNKYVLEVCPMPCC